MTQVHIHIDRLVVPAGFDITVFTSAIQARIQEALVSGAYPASFDGGARRVDALGTSRVASADPAALGAAVATSVTGVLT